MTFRQQDLQDQEYSFPYHYLSSFAPDFSQGVHDTWGINYVSAIDYLLQQLLGMEFNSIVDVGCGDGRLTREIAVRFPGKSVLGVDYSERATNLAKAMNADIGSLSFICCDMADNWEAGRFDVAVLMEVFEHIPPAEGQTFLSALHNILRPGGTLLLTVPHINKPVEPKHFRHFNVATISAELGEEFDVVEVVPFERMGLARKAMNLILANDLFQLSNRILLNRIYRYYKSHLFHCNGESECQRIYVRATAK